MKKSIIFAVVLVFLLCLTACGGGNDTVATEPEAETTVSAAPESTEPSPEPSEEPADLGTALTTEFWSVSYSDDWSYNEEEDLYESEGYYSSATLSIMDGEDAIVSAYIDATIEGPGYYRDYLKDAGIDAYEMVENNAVEFVSIGGVDCVESIGEYWGDPCLSYYGRVEGANATVLVQITGEYDDEMVAALLDTLSFTLEDFGNIDPPWPWNGEPFSTESTVSAMVGTYTLNAQWLPTDESLITDDIFSGRVVASGDKVYVLLDGVLKQYANDGTSLTYEMDIPLNDDYEEICVDTNGVLSVSGFMADFIQIKDGEIIFSYDGPDYVAMHPSGTWGISWFSGSDVDYITLSGGTLQMETWTFAEVDIISSVSISENYIFVSGSSVAHSEQSIFVYDLNGNLQLTLGDKEFGEPDSLGSITAVIETASGFVGIDGNMRDVCLWTTDGTYIGSLEDSDLFGTYYPWMSSAASMADGSIIVGMTEEREDSSADEFIVFILSGF